MESQTLSTTTTGGQTWAPTGLSLQISLHPRSQEEETYWGKKNFSTRCFPAGCCEFTKYGTFGQHLRRWHSREVFFQTFSCQVQIGMVGGQVSLSCVFSCVFVFSFTSGACDWPVCFSRTKQIQFWTFTNQNWGRRTITTEMLLSIITDCVLKIWDLPISSSQ